MKTFATDTENRYPDLNSTVELFTNQEMLEVETLGPLVTLSPGSAVTHKETWWLFPNVTQPVTEDEVLKSILPIINNIVSGQSDGPY